MNPFDDRTEDDVDEDLESATCKRCGKEGLILEMVGGSPKLFEHVGMRLRDHKCDFTTSRLDGFD